MPVVRDLADTLAIRATRYPVVLVTGPRQSGKTTLCTQTFPGKRYLSLEAPDVREHARIDPRGFLSECRDGAILDEVQYAPDLLSYIQVEVDREPAPGRFILTGSQQMGLMESASQSLAGRVGILYLLPPSLTELRRFARHPAGLFETLWAGAYPRIHDVGFPPQEWLADYVRTYVERDVRQLLNIESLRTFTTFLRLCAGRTGQELNLSSLGSDAGISHNTTRSWISVLEASFICVLLPSWHRRVTRQAVRAPKIHFLDTGLACYLLGIRSADQLVHHPLRGAIFESWVAGEILKSRHHAGLPPGMSHFRDSKGLEVDLVVELDRELALVEAKSGATVAEDFLVPLRRLAERSIDAVAGREPSLRLIYGGKSAHSRTGVDVVPWEEIHSLSWT